MGMSERVARLRQRSLDAVPTLSPERATLMTRFYQEHTARMSAPVERALPTALVALSRPQGYA
jgi:hypothetical protein